MLKAYKSKPIFCAPSIPIYKKLLSIIKHIEEAVEINKCLK